MADKPPRKATKAEFGKMEPQVVEPGKARTWITRGGNFAVAVSEVEPGAVFARDDNPEEYMVILPPGSVAATIEAGGTTIEAKADSLTIVPPGPSRITVTAKGRIARIFSKASADIMALAWNNDVYADGAPELAPPDLWPEPYDGYRLRHYPLAPYAKPDGDRIQPRVFRSTNMLVNIFVHYQTRRDTTKLSPHWHDDFEQASLTLNGRWVHHMRYNWGPDLSAWIPDDHGEMDTPSVIFIPATAVHTSRDVGEGESSLYDLFCPPRMDFASKKGFVINEDEYPLPAVTGDGKVKTGGSLLSWQKPG
jgi:mannose-6-phosphate isomerase-like protein (cupin superfamily)